MVQLRLVRGLPGSGKSTIARQMQGFHHLEADMYHMVDGEYKFDFRNLHDAHEWCRQSAYDLLKDGFNVVVSNTFTQFWEMVPYFQMAKELGVKVSVIEATGRYQNIHNVPEEVVEKMEERWEVYV